MTRSTNSPGRKEEGLALIVALIMLLVMTVVGVLGMEETALEERMLQNMRDKSVSADAGDSMLRSLERFLASESGRPEAFKASACAEPPYCGQTKAAVWEAGEQPWRQHLDDWPWWLSQAMPYGGQAADAPRLAGVSQRPHGLIEYDGFDLSSEDLSFGVAVTDSQTAARGIGPHYYTIVGTAAGLRADNEATTEWREDTTSTVESRFIKIL